MSEKIAKREYEATHKDDRSKRDRKRAIAEGGVRRGFSLKIKQDLLKKQLGICLCCFTTISNAQDGQVDHAKPLSRGVRNDPPNLFLVHARCNKEKRGKTFPEHWEWRVRQGLDSENLGLKHGFLDLFKLIHYRSPPTP